MSRWVWKAWAAYAAFVFVMVVLLLVLRSEGRVWVWIVFLGLLAGLGVRRLLHAINVTVGAVDALFELGKQLRTFKSREDLLEYLSGRVSPTDSTNAPEALLQFSHSRFSGEQAQLTATGVYGYSGSALDAVSFLRGVLVLLGLFGTVGFFALSLGEFGTERFDLVIPLLRGALVSTLGGILGSLLLGWLGSSVATVRDELILETQAFVSGPVLQVLGTRAVEKDFRSEAELWEELRQEVAGMTQRTAEAYGKVGDDVHAYAASLQKLSDQLSDLPQVRVPPELANLETVVSDFARAAESLNRLVPPLVDAVQTAGEIFPVKAAQALAKTQDMVSEATAHVLATEKSTNAISGELSLIVANASATEEAARNAADAASEGKTAAETALKELRSQARHVDESVGRLDAATVRVGEHVGVVDQRVGTVVDRLERLEHVLDSVVRAGQHIAAVADGLTKVARSLDQARPGFDRLSKDLSKLRRIVSWHERAEDAPLMRLLLLPWWPKGRFPFMRSGA